MLQNNLIQQLCQEPFLANKFCRSWMINEIMSMFLSNSINWSQACQTRCTFPAIKSFCNRKNLTVYSRPLPVPRSLEAGLLSVGIRDNAMAHSAASYFSKSIYLVIKELVVFPQTRVCTTHNTLMSCCQCASKIEHYAM